MIFATRGCEDEKLAALDDEGRRRLVMQEARRYFPEFPEEPVLTKLFRWDRAVNLLSPEQFCAIQDLLDNHLHDVSDLHLAGEYLFPIVCTERTLSTGKADVETVISEFSPSPGQLRRKPLGILHL